MDARVTADDRGSRRDSPQLAERYTSLLRQHEIEVRLADRLGSGCEFPAMFASIVALSDLPIWLFDAAGLVVLQSGENQESLDISSLCAELGSREQKCRMAIARTASGVARRCLVAPVLGAETDDMLGWLVMGAGVRNFGGLDYCLLDRGRIYLARHHKLHQAMQRSVADLTRGLVERLLRHGEQDGSPAEYALQIGIEADSTCVIVAIDDSALPGGIEDIDALIASLQELVAGRVFGARTLRGPALIIDAGVAERIDDSRMIEAVCRALSASLPDSGVQCGVSSAVGIDSITDGYDEALEIVACLERFTADHTRILSVRDLGPARILVANGNIAAIRRYVEHTLGPLWSDHADNGMETLLATLAQFSRVGHNVRRTAAVMSVHENTVRQRLARVRKLTGLDMLNDPFAQLSVHTALAIIALRNRAHPLWDPRARALQRSSRFRHEGGEIR